VVIITDHSDFDYEAIHEKAKLIVDTRNAYRNRKSEKIVRL
jgi:UDP-N-acetyl-D-glucosamine dehydrogenase